MNYDETQKEKEQEKKWEAWKKTNVADKLKAKILFVSWNLWTNKLRCGNV